MAATEIHPTAVIEGLFLPSDPEQFVTNPVDSLTLDLEPNGIVGGRHFGNTTLADIRVPAYRKKVDTVLNRQSVSFVSSEDLDFIADELRLDPDVLQESHYTSEADIADNPRILTRQFLARCLGANILLGGFTSTATAPNFRNLAAGVDFGPYDSEARKFTDATVMITRVNHPCMPPGRKLQESYPIEVPDLAKRFVAVAQGRHGLYKQASRIA